MELDPSTVAHWLQPLAKRPEEIAEVFAERRREATIEWHDGEVREARAMVAEGVSARWRGRGGERLAFLSRGDEEGAREAVRALQKDTGLSPLPVKPSRARPAPPTPADVASLDVERWTRRLTALFARHAPRHPFRCTLRDFARQVIPARGAASTFARRLLSLEGSFTAASRRGDENREFSFHAPVGESTFEELRVALNHAGEPRETATPCGEGETDAVLGAGCAAMLFHEILSHPLEAGAESPLNGLEQARLAVAELDVRDDATRLDPFGGYETDDEGPEPGPVKLVDAGRLFGRLTLLVAAVHAPPEEMTRRLASGLWIDQIDGGSVELASGRFRLRFPRARCVRRSRMADECGPGVLSGEILTVLGSIDPGIGREVRAYRTLGWCAHGGHVVPVGGAAPDVLVRRFSVRRLW